MSFELTLLGGFDLRRDGATIAGLAKPRAQALLAYLALRRLTPQPRRQVAFVFWPDSTEAQARTNLRHLLHDLRELVPAVDDLLHIDVHSLQWRLDAPCTVDVITFEQRLVDATRAAGPAEE